MNAIVYLLAIMFVVTALYSLLDVLIRAWVMFRRKPELLPPPETLEYRLARALKNWETLK